MRATWRPKLLRRLSLGLLVPLGLAALACGGDSNQAAPGKKSDEGKKAPAELSWQIRQVRLNEPCRAAPGAAAPAATGSAGEAGGAAHDDTCVRFFATWPEFEAGMPRPLLKRLNDAVKELATSPSFDERRAGSVDGTGRKLIAAWKARVQEKKGEVERWSDQRQVTILHRDEKVISFRFEEQLSSGGAHELATVLYVSYSLDRIDRLSMADLFVEGSAQKLNELGEKRFRELRKIAPGHSLADAGFDFPGGIFRLSSNFAVRADGLVFRYNPYDIGPFALGETEVVLTAAEVKDLLRPKGPLGG